MPPFKVAFYERTKNVLFFCRITIQCLFSFFNLIPDRYLFIPNEKGNYGKGSKNSCENYPLRITS